MKLLNDLSAARLLSIDLAGALLSAVLLGIVLPIWQPHFGIPLRVLYLLATFPVGFALFDGYALSRSATWQRKGLRVISGLNVGYCGLSLALACYHRTQLTKLGWAYLIGEILLVLSVALVEWRLAHRLQEPIL